MARQFHCDVCKRATEEVVGKLCSTCLAWAAGFFDGEGGTYIQHNARKRKYLKIIVGQKHREPLDRIRRIFQCGNITQRANGIYVWQVCTGDDVHHVLEMMWPYLTEIKRLQANIAIDLCNESRLVA